MAKLNKVCTNIVQDFTDTEKAQARTNISASQIKYDNAVTDMTVMKEIVRPYMNIKYTATIGSDNFLLLPGSFADGMVVKNNGSLQTQSIPQGLPSGGTAGQALIVDPSGNPVWSTFNAVPASTVADKTKVLTVNDQGIAEWAPSSVSVTPYYQVVNVSLAGGNMQWPNTVPITGTSIPAGKTFIGTITLSSFRTDVTELVNIEVFGGNVNVERSYFYRGAEWGGALFNTFTIPVKHVNSNNAAEPLEFGLNGSVDAQTIAVIVQGITY